MQYGSAGNQTVTMTSCQDTPHEAIIWSYVKWCKLLHGKVKQCEGSETY